MKSISLLMTLMILLTAFSLTAQTSIGISAGASFTNVTIKSGLFLHRLNQKPALQ